jgi:diacylglycerol kinase (ATP)
LRSRERLAARAETLGSKLEYQLTESADHASELATRAAAEGVPLILAYGGDGTYNAVARGLLGSRTSMGVLPGGTTSVLAYEFEIPRPAARSVEALLTGNDRRMRVGRTDRGDVVLLMVSAGPDSHVLRRLHPALKPLGGRIGVALQALVEAVAGSALPRLRVVAPGVGEEVGWAIVGNSRCYGSRFHGTPGADPFGDYLEIVARRGMGRRAAISFLFGIPSGRHVVHPDALRVTASHVRLEPASPDEDVPYQVDGDVTGILPVEIGVDPRPLMIRVPVRGRNHFSHDP